MLFIKHFHNDSLRIITKTFSEQGYAPFGFSVVLTGYFKPDETIYQVKGDSLGNDNILGATEDCILEEFSVSGISTQFNFTVPQYSATVIRIKTK